MLPMNVPQERITKTSTVKVTKRTSTQFLTLDTLSAI